MSAAMIRSARSCDPATRLYMSPAVEYTSGASAGTSSSRARRTRGASATVERRDGRPYSLLERGRLPAELLLRPGGVRPGVPAEEVELPARQERLDPRRARDGLADRGSDPGGNGRQRPRYAP